MFRTLTDLVLSARPHIPHIPPLSIGPRGRVGVLVGLAYGMQEMLRAPAYVNIAALCLSMPRMVSHRLSSGAVRMIHDTDLHALPGQPPRLLEQAWIAEVRHPEREALFDDTVSLGMYALDGRLYLVGVRYPDGIVVSSVLPVWEEREISAYDPDHSWMVAPEDREAFRAWTLDAFRFAVMFGVHMEAEGSPIVTADERQRSRGGSGARASAGSVESDWVVRRVYLDRIVRRPVGDGAEKSADTTSADGRDRIETQAMVRGHMRRQVYGPGRGLRKWVYVESYEARRWIAPRPLRVDVSTQSKGEES